MVFLSYLGCACLNPLGALRFLLRVNGLRDTIEQFSSISESTKNAPFRNGVSGCALPVPGRCADPTCTNSNEGPRLGFARTHQSEAGAHDRDASSGPDRPFPMTRRSPWGNVATPQTAKTGTAHRWSPAG